MMVCIIFLLSMLPFTYAGVYLVDNGDNVDSGGHLDWDYSTDYLSECRSAQGLWNSYKSGVIREDTFTTIQDLYVYDYYSASTTVMGARNQFYSIIKLNGYYFDSGNPQSLTYLERKKVVIHEFGHALGLGHNTTNNDAIMKQGRFDYGSLHQDDKDSYDAAAKLY